MALSKRAIFLARLKSWGWGSFPPFQKAAKNNKNRSHKIDKAATNKVFSQLDVNIVDESLALRASLLQLVHA